MSEEIEGTGRLIGEFLGAAISERMADVVAKMPAPVVHFDTAEFAKTLEDSGSRETLNRILPELKSAVDLIANAIASAPKPETLDISGVADSLSELAQSITAMTETALSQPAPDHSALIEAIAANTAALQSLEAAHRMPKDVRYDAQGRVASIAPRMVLQ